MVGFMQYWLFDVLLEAAFLDDLLSALPFCSLAKIGICHFLLGKQGVPWTARQVFAYQTAGFRRKLMVKNGKKGIFYPLSGACPPYGARPVHSGRSPSATYNRA
ncbi:MAG: hypothetical protein II397_11015 [Treponema sp.]|nr:hypothetical protein [Treponema sp.]